MQKAIRRADTKLAGYWALELWASGYGNYVWKRLLTVSAEDVCGLITTEIKALYESYELVNKGAPVREHKGRIFISKAVILLCAARKSCDADQLAADLLAAGREEVPDYAFDCHTLKGTRKGKTKADFFREEQRALKPFQPGLFDDLPEG